MADDDVNTTGRITRRAVLGTMAAGAGSMVLGSAGVMSGIRGAAADSAHASPDTSETGPSENFGRIFPRLPPFAEPSPQLRAALLDLGRAHGILDANDDLAAGAKALIVDPNFNGNGNPDAVPPVPANNPDNTTHTAGVTFFGQFLDHDVTFDASSKLFSPAVPESTRNFRTPAFDLDTLYGEGFVSSQLLYDPDDRVKLRVESGGLFEDLPRDRNNTAIIGDPRNDENLMIAGLHCAFILFYNHMVDRVRASGVSDIGDVFDRARRLVTWHYHWLIVNEFLPLIVGADVVADVLNGGRRFFRPDVAVMPVEFQGGCYRFGHSMVRPSYRANLQGDGGQPFFGLVFDPTENGSVDPADLRGGARAPRRFIGWQTFFDFGDGNVKHNKKIDTVISSPLLNLPLGAIASHDAPTSLPQRNLLRQVTWGLPSGQRIARHIGVTPLHRADLSELAGYDIGLERSTPLWYYTLKEAEIAADGEHLGPVGARIVAEVFLGLLQLDKGSYLNVQPSWTPTLPSRLGAGRFDMVDLLRLAGVDPTSRGQ